ncbi:MAG: hypothetical protein NVS1B6_13050 [Steroidobacteraceae bacterium]
MGRITRWLSRGPAALTFALVIALMVDAAAAGTQTHTIVNPGRRVNPEALTVHRGDRIVWRNKDLVPHRARQETR